MTLKPSVCIDAVLAGYSIEEALDIVAASGFGAFEFWGWWNRDLDALETARDRAGLAISACCTRCFNLVDPGQREEYLAGLRESIAVARRLQCGTLISQVGNFRPGVARAEQHQSLVDGLLAAAPLLEDTGITLVIEPLNELVDHAGYYLTRSDEAFEIIEKIGSPRVNVVFDIYHQQVTEGHLIHNITTNIDRIGHFHAAGNPGRHELTKGEINYPAVFETIEASGYDGYVGLEYFPEQDPAIGLREVAQWFALG